MEDRNCPIDDVQEFGYPAVVLTCLLTMHEAADCASDRSAGRSRRMQQRALLGLVRF